MLHVALSQAVITCSGVQDVTCSIVQTVIACSAVQDVTCSNIQVVITCVVAGQLVFTCSAGWLSCKLQIATWQLVPVTIHALCCLMFIVSLNCLPICLCIVKNNSVLSTRLDYSCTYRTLNGIDHFLDLVT